MDTRKKLRLPALLLLALLLRIVLRAETAFFCDVPRSLAAIESGRMIIQFPGYAPYQNLIQTLMFATGATAASAMSWFALICGYGAVLYTAYLVHAKAGQRACLLASIVMGFSVFPVYFSCVRATYVTDMLAAAGMLTHGYAYLAQKKQSHYYGVLAWFCFGFLMRPLSFACTGLALAYLLFYSFDKGRTFRTGACLAGTAILLIGISLPYYGSLGAILASPFALGSELQSFSMVSFLTNLFRLAIYPLWGLHAYLAFTVVAWLRHRPSFKQPYLLFILLLMAPYFLLLIRYIPHAGYYALLLPGLVVLPWCCRTPPPAPRIGYAVLLAIVFLAQLFLVRPIRVTGPVALVANAYVFQYSAAGLRDGMFETLASLAHKTGVMKDRIPEYRHSDAIPPPDR